MEPTVKKYGKVAVQNGSVLGIEPDGLCNGF
jgi:hypothetical protein